MRGRPFVLGLTGGICCGKSEAARHLRSLGAAHIDADAISRAVTAPGGEALPQIRAAFGDGVFHVDGSLDRAALAGIVFTSPEEKRRLEEIIHPLVWAWVRRDIEAAEAPVVILDVPLLFESGMDALCDEVWVLSVPPDVQLARIRARDGLSAEAARARIASQMKPEERNARAARVFNTDGPMEETRAQLSAAYQALCARLG